MLSKNTLSAGTLAMALSLGGLGLGIQSCATAGSAKGGETTMKGSQKSCAAAKGGDHKCGEAAMKGGDKKCGKGADKGEHKGCGESSCG